MHCTWAMMVACIVVSIPIGCIVWTMRSFLVTHTCMDSRSRMTIWSLIITPAYPLVLPDQRAWLGITGDLGAWLCIAGRVDLVQTEPKQTRLYSSYCVDRLVSWPVTRDVSLIADFSHCWFLWLLIADSWQERWSGCLATAPWSGKPSSRTRGGWSGTSGALFAGSGGGYLIGEAGSGGGYLLVQLVK